MFDSKGGATPKKATELTYTFCLKQPWYGMVRRPDLLGLPMTQQPCQKICEFCEDVKDQATADKALKRWMMHCGKNKG